MKYSEMIDYCNSNRESDGFCRLCNSCSGACVSNLAKDYPFKDGTIIYRGGSYGSCMFEVEREELEIDSPTPRRSPVKGTLEYLLSV